MNILLCANTSWYLYNFRKNLIAKLQKSGFDVYAFAPFDAYSRKLEELGVHYFHLPLHQTSKHPLQELRSLVSMFFLLNRLKPDMMLTFTVKCNLYVGLLNMLFRIPHISNVSGLGELFDNDTLFTRLIKLFYRIALHHSHKVFFQNIEDLNVFVGQGILPAEMCERLPGSGVDLSVFTPFSPSPSSTGELTDVAQTSGHSFKSTKLTLKPSQKKSVGFQLENNNEKYVSKKDNRRVFLMFGRIVPKKGYDLFLEAARRIGQKYPGQAECWILGIKDTSRQESLDLFRKIMEYHEYDMITYLPQTDDVIPIIRQADVVVLPSQYHEGVPRCLLEAMACGKPLITTNWKGCRETVEDGINGFLIEPGNVDALVRRMEKFLYTDSEMLAKMGRASREKAEKEFDERVVLSKYLTEIHRWETTRISYN